MPGIPVWPRGTENFPVSTALSYMALGRRASRKLDMWLIDGQARRIADPVERLRYLRQTMRAAGAGSPHWLPARRVLHLGAATFLLLLPIQSVSNSTGFWREVLAPPAIRPSGALAEIPTVWLVEKNAQFELYSNGLRVEHPFKITTELRRYPAFPLARLKAGQAEWRSEPAGIVFHTSESDLAPFESDQNRTLRRQGQSLVMYARENRLYHFVIDRFGRVHNVVEETDRANHAGHSIWADSRWVYLNLNSSFLGVSFEAATRPGEEVAALSPAQAHSGRVLTEMLRSKYSIPAEDCVTHAQVSVNPNNFLIGYHTDWGASFPFDSMGLPDNYARAVPSLWLFGFYYDETFAQANGGCLWRGLAQAEEKVREEAQVRGVPVAQLRTELRRNFREITKALSTPGAN